MFQRWKPKADLSHCLFRFLVFAILTVLDDKEAEFARMETKEVESEVPC